MSIYYVSAEPTQLTSEQIKVLEALERLHGDIYVTRESSGIHANLASPEALHRDGEVELKKRHLAVNLTKAFLNAGDGKSYAMCMKYRTVYNLDSLLRMQPLEKRGFGGSQARSTGESITFKNRDRMEEIAPGRYVPWQPGVCIPVQDLGDRHPARAYLEARGYTCDSLQRQFRAAFCVERHPRVIHGSTHAAFPKTVQGRLIFFSYAANNVYNGWQGRLLQKSTQHGVYYYHPLHHRYVKVYSLQADGTKVYDEPWNASDVPKYLTAIGMSRSSALVGAHAAATLCEGVPYIVLTEGPLDAARLGPPACATLGKFVSDVQLRMARAIAPNVVYISQNDSSGEEARDKFKRSATRLGIPVTVLVPPNSFNDIGDMEPQQAIDWFEETTGFTIPHKHYLLPK
jgi:hypothetical protein